MRLPQVSLALLQVAPGHDEGREATEIPTRKGAKKAAAKGLTPEQAEALKAQPNTPQGRRDALIMALLLDHGLQVGDVAGLLVTDIDLRSGDLRFYRPKVDVEQTHRLASDALRAALAYLHHDVSAMGPLLRASHKDGRLHDMGMTERAITDNTDPNSPRRHRGHGDSYVSLKESMSPTFAAEQLKLLRLPRNWMF